MADPDSWLGGAPPPPERKSLSSKLSRTGMRPSRGTASPPQRRSSGGGPLSASSSSSNNPLLSGPPSFRTPTSAIPRNRSKNLTDAGVGFDPNEPDYPVPPVHASAREPPPAQVPFRFNKAQRQGASEPLVHHHVKGVECLACVVEKQRGDLEAMRLRLAHASAEASSLRQQQDLLHRERPKSPASTQLQQANLQGVGNSLNYYKEQIRQLKYSVAQAEASQQSTEGLLLQALQRPPVPPAVPIKDSGAQTYGLDQIDILVNGEKPDSEGSDDSDDEFGYRKGGKKGGMLAMEEKANLIGEMRTAVDAGVASALQKSSWLFGKQATTTAANEDASKNDQTSGAIPRLILDNSSVLSPEEIFYEMCAALGEAHAESENQAIQVNNAGSFWKLYHSRILNMQDDIETQIQHHETLMFLAERVSPVHYCNNPLGFLFSQIIKTREEAEMMAHRQEDLTHAQVYGLGKKLDDTREEEDPNYNLWTDLLKRLIILLSRNTHCLQPQVVLFNYEVPSHTGIPTIREYSSLEFAVEYHLDEVVLLICDAQERLPVDYWECVHGYPFHKSLYLGRASENATKYMLRAASTVPDDRFGILKTDDTHGMFPFYIALMHAHDIHGVIDDLLDLLMKRNFKLNLKWTGWTETEPREEWHLLQWAAYQGVDRIFKLTRTHPDFFQKCQTSLRKQSPNVLPKGSQPLHLACLSGSVAVVDTLCQEISQVLKAASSPIWNEGQTPLHIAAQQCHYRCIEKILDFAKDKWGWSAKVQEEKLFGVLEHKTRWTKRTSDFEYSVYGLALLTLVHRRHILRDLETAPEEADDDLVANNEDEIVRQKREIEVANFQVKFLNEKHPEKLRSFAQAQIKKSFYPWLLFIGLITYFAASETWWLSDFNYHTALAIEKHFANINIQIDGRDKTYTELDNHHEVREWMYVALKKMPETFTFSHSVSVGATRLRQIVIRSDSCTVGPTVFQQTPNGPQRCAGAVSNQRANVFFIDWMFDTILSDPRDDHEQEKNDIKLGPEVAGEQLVSKWQSESETGESGYYSPLGQQYPGSGFVIDFDWNSEASYTLAIENFHYKNVNAQQDGYDGWVNLGTRALFFATTFYNPATDQYIAGNILFELPPFGGVFVKARWQSLRLIRNYDGYLDYFTITVEVLLGIIVVLMFVRKIFEFMYLLKGHFKGFTIRKLFPFIWGAVQKVATGSNVLDVVTIGMFLAVFTWRLMIRREALDLQEEFEEHATNGVLETSFFFPFERISSHYATRLSTMGVVLMLVYMKILVIVRLHRNVGPISIAIVQTLFNMRIFYFAIILLLLLLSLSFAAYFAFGEFAGEFSSLFISVCPHTPVRSSHRATISLRVTEREIKDG